MSSLAYARAINEPKEFGKGTRIRDCYLFAAPIICDLQSVQGKFSKATSKRNQILIPLFSAFNNRMYHDPNRPRTMWRVTYGNDMVATGLPNMGDHPRWNLSPYNMMSFAHLGTEIRMKPKPNRSRLRGNHLLQGSHVRIESVVEQIASGEIEDFDYEVDENHVDEEPTAPNLVAKLGNFASYIPIISRMVDHGTNMYWDGVCRFGLPR